MLYLLLPVVMLSYLVHFYMIQKALHSGYVNNFRVSVCQITSYASLMLTYIVVYLLSLVSQLTQVETVVIHITTAIYFAYYFVILLIMLIKYISMKRQNHDVKEGFLQFSISMFQNMVLVISFPFGLIFLTVLAIGFAAAAAIGNVDPLVELFVPSASVAYWFIFSIFISLSSGIFVRILSKF